MGQAKIRSEVIKALKAKNANSKASIGNKINLIAIKNCKDGSKQFTMINFNVINCDKSKDQLLFDICNKDWKSHSMHQKITNYFSLTSNYKILKFMGLYGFVVNFYEQDNDYGGAYSCREIFGIRDKDSYDNTLKEYFKEAVAFFVL